MASKKTTDNITKYRKNTSNGNKSKSGNKTNNKNSKSNDLKKRKAYVPEDEPKKKMGLFTAASMGVVIALVLELCNFNVFGKFGGWIKYGQFGLFGSMAYIFPLVILLEFIVSTFEEKRKRTFVSIIFAFIFLSTFSHLVSTISLNNQNVLSYFKACADTLSGGGIIGGAIAFCLYTLLSKTGAVIITVIVMLVSLFIIFEDPIRHFYDSFLSRDEDMDYYDEDDDYEDELPVKKNGRKKAVQEMAAEERITRIPKAKPVQKREKTSKYYDETLYEAYDDDGRVIRIVKAKKRRGRTHTTPLTRSINKAQPLRDGSIETVRTGNKVRGLGNELEMIPSYASGDELHEITRRRKVNESKYVNTDSKNMKTADRKDPSRVNRAVNEPIVRRINEPAYEQLSFDEEELMKQPDILEETGFVPGGVFNRPEASVTAVSQAAVNKRAKEERPVKVRNVQQASLPETARADRPMSHISEPVSSANRPTTYKTETAASAAVKTNNPTVKAEAVSIKLKNSSEDTFFTPPVELLAPAKSKNATSEAELEKIARDLEIILNQFGVHVTVTDIQAGPSVTRFELQPELGTRVNKITSLADDLKLNLGVTEIRIEAPIPGRQAVGIEIPNKNRQTVYMRELMEEPTLINHPSKIAFAAGKDISGNVIVADIAKMPHLLVAGTTGSGKSVFLNSILMTILYRATPAEVGLIIIDPKKVEFGVYAGIPHLMREVVTDPGQAVSTLRWAVNEMTNRYQRMQMSSVRDFKSYNAKVDKGTVNPNEENPRKMNQIVIIIDELADLMMVAKKEAEALICRLAQLARAAGIHLIIATQRPSVDVVTGLIKANVPARVALLVSSQIDSRTIIDMQGAEKLLGNGDMLFYPTGYVKPVRIQGAYVSDDEIQETVDYLIDNNSTDYFAAESKEIEKFMNSSSSESSEASGSGSEGGDNASKYDEYFFEAGKLCIEMGKASSSMLQRRFNLGFNRAARIIDQLQEFGVVGPQNGAKPRQILVDTVTFEEMYENINN